jgi:ectoine hydroxylase-related dioxygenase (phytanoyl-CoA dioxygenase family)
VADLSEQIAGAAHDARLLQLLEELYGEPAYLFKDKLIYKADGAPGYDLHQDYIAWEEFPKSFVTAIVAIDGSDERSGGTEFFPGEHLNGLLSPANGQFNRLAPDALSPGARGTIPVLNPGDVVVFGGFLPHRSAPNRSGRSRRLLYLSYNAAGDGGDAREAHYRQFHAWLRERYAEHGKLGTYFR